MKKKLIPCFLGIIMLLIHVNLAAYNQDIYASESPGSFTVRYLGVRGDSSLITLDTGKRKINIMIDTGESMYIKSNIPNSKRKAEKDGEYMLNILEENKKDWLSKRGKKYVIDYLIITHTHRDHNGGLFDLLDSGNYIIGQIFYNDAHPNRNNHEKKVRDILDKAVKNKKINKLNYVGARYEDDSNDEIKTHPITLDHLREQYDLFLKIYPAVRIFEKKGFVNNSSMLVKCKYGGKSYVFTGDIQANGTRDALVYYGNSLLSTDETYLKLPHHASRRAQICMLAMVDSSLSDLKYECSKALRKEMGLNVLDLSKIEQNYDNSLLYCNALLEKEQETITIDGQTYTPYYLDEFEGKEINKYVINFDEELQKIFSIGDSKLIGIGNVKMKSRADAEIFLAIKSLDEYYDIAPEKYMENYKRPDGILTPTYVLGSTLTVRDGIICTIP